VGPSPDVTKVPSSSNVGFCFLPRSTSTLLGYSVFLCLLVLVFVDVVDPTASLLLVCRQPCLLRAPVDGNPLSIVLHLSVISLPRALVASNPLSLVLHSSVSVFWVRPHTRGCPSRCFRSRTVSPTVAKWFVPDARGTMDSVYRFGPL
jgi:hypothetical protein